MNTNPIIKTQGGAGFLQGVSRPTCLSTKSRQLVVYVRDASPSMAGPKATDAAAAGVDLVDELAKPENKNGFEVGVVDFAGRAKTVHPIDKATALNGRVVPINTSLFGGSTNITDGLREAEVLVDQSAASRTTERLTLRPVVILFSDGCHNSGAHPRDAANGVKAKADLVTVAFGADADEALLRQLATSPQHFYRCTNGRNLRMFLAAVGKTLTGTMAKGTNGTIALSQIKQ